MEGVPLPVVGLISTAAGILFWCGCGGPELVVHAGTMASGVRAPVHGASYAGRCAGIDGAIRAAVRRRPFGPHRLFDTRRSPYRRRRAARDATTTGRRSDCGRSREFGCLGSRPGLATRHSPCRVASRPLSEGHAGRLMSIPPGRPDSRSSRVHIGTREPNWDQLLSESSVEAIPGAQKTAWCHPPKAEARVRIPSDYSLSLLVRAQFWLAACAVLRQWQAGLTCRRARDPKRDQRDEWRRGQRWKVVARRRFP